MLISSLKKTKWIIWYWDVNIWVSSITNVAELTYQTLSRTSVDAFELIITTTMMTYNNATADRRWARCKQWTRDRDRDRGPMHWPREQRTWVMQSTTGSTTPDVIQAINPPDTACFVYTSFFHRRYRHSDNKVLNVPLHLGPFCLIVFCYLNGF